MTYMTAMLKGDRITQGCRSKNFPMSDIFISYAREDEPRAEMLAKTLEGRGWSIFWDRTIPIGKTWRQTIGRELNDARCVIVLWSKTSIESGWVQDEADDANRRGVLVPILIEKVEPPMGFRSIQAAHLENWDGTEPTQAFHRLIADIVALIGLPNKETENERRQVEAEIERKAEAERKRTERELQRQADEEHKRAQADSKLKTEESVLKAAPMEPPQTRVSAKVGIVALMVLGVLGLGGIIWSLRPSHTDRTLYTPSVSDTNAPVGQSRSELPSGSIIPEECFKDGQLICTHVPWPKP
jgi:hypothetical protein